MVKCPKKLINQLTKWVNMLKGCLHQGGENLGCFAWVRITSIFSFPTHIYAHFARQITKRLQNVFNVVTKHRQDWNTEHIMQFFKIAAYVHIAQLYGLVHYAACVFCHIYMACGLLLWMSIAYQAVLCVLGLYGRWVRESVSVFDGLVYL